MVRWLRQHGPWLTLGVLALLLAALALLQYRWIGEIGRAEAERRRTQLERSAARFAAGLDRELARVLVELHPQIGPHPDHRALLLERLASWARTEQGPLVSRVLLALRHPDGKVTLEACAASGSGCTPAAWTPPLDALRDRLLADRDDREPGGGRGPLRPGMLLDEPLALVLPLLDPSTSGPSAPERERVRGPFPLWAGRRAAGFLVIELDADYVRRRLLPQLAEAYFGPLRESDFVVAVLRRADHSLLYASDPSLPARALQQAELTLPLPDRRRPGADELPDGERRFPGWNVAGRRERFLSRWPAPTAESSPWLLMVRHRDGSIEQSVAALRRRNLAVGLGVLALLGSAAALLVTGTQRARSLARQQIEFVAGVTHELNTPLAGIRSAGQNLAAGIVTDAGQVRRYGELIDQEGRRLAAIVAQVLDFAGIESGQRGYAASPVALAPLVDEVAGELGLALEQSGMTLEQELPSDLPKLRGDAPALRRMLTNLLTNAIKFASSGKRVRLRAAARGDGQAVVLRVEDAGPGIPPAERERVFEPFHRGSAAQRNDAPGSGLGLSLVRRIVQAHRGRVWIEEADGGGTAVVVELPLAAGARP